MVSPERISFAINPAVSTITTVVNIRDQYNEVDCRLIAKEVLLYSFLIHGLNYFDYYIMNDSSIILTTDGDYVT